MASFVRLRNNATGKEYDIPSELYEQRKHGRTFKTAYTVVTIINEPPEVVALQKAKRAEKPADNKI